MREETGARSFYEFGPFVVDEGRRRLLRGGDPVPLTRKEFQTLLVLVRGGGRLVEKGELMEAVWPDAHVEEGNLAVHVSKLRGKLGRREDGSHYIETELGQGYRFSARVHQVADFDLVVRKRERAHVVTEEVEETGAAAAGAEAPPLPGPKATARRRLTRRGVLAAASVAAFVLAASAFALRYGPARRAAERPAAAAGGVRTLAVLPFTLINGGAEDEYMGLGMADALITRLSNVRQVVVRPTSASRRAAATGADALHAARALSVEAVLEGSIQKAAGRLRVTAQLVRTADGVMLWAEAFDAPQTDVFDVQDAVSERLVAALVPELTGSERASLARRYAGNAEAYRLYAKGRYYWNRRDYDGMIRAEAFFRQAVELDPQFALAYVGLADTLATRGPDDYDETYRAQQKALELSPDLGEAHASRGFANMFHRWDWAGAERDLRRAVELNPGYATAHHWLAILLAITGRSREAKEAMARALEIDPHSPNFLADMGQIHYFAREYEEAEKFCRRALEAAPDFYFAHHHLAYIYTKMGRHDGALEEHMSAAQIMSGLTKYSDAEAAARERRAYKERFRRSGLSGYLRETIQKVSGRAADDSAAYGFAMHHAMLGEKEQALGWLEKAVGARIFLAAFAGVDPVFDDLRNDPRYQKLMRGAGLAREM